MELKYCAHLKPTPISFYFVRKMGNGCNDFLKHVQSYMEIYVIRQKSILEKFPQA